MEEQTVAELEFENARLHVDLNLTRFDGCMLMVDRLLSMHNHVQNYGIDRTFLALYNERNLLSKVCDVRFPACEDVLSDYDLNKQYFEACMEGLGRAIKDAFKWVIEKIKALFNWIGEMWKKFWGLFKNKSEENKKLIDKLRSAVLKDDAEFDAKYVSQDTINKFNEIMKKLESVNNQNDFLNTTGLSIDVLDQMCSYVEKINFNKDTANNEVKTIEIKNNAGAKQLLTLLENNNKGFSPLTAAIGTAIKRGNEQIANLEKNQAQLEKAHANMQESANKTNVGEEVKKCKAAVVTYRKRVNILSKMLKAVLDGTVLTNKSLKTMMHFCKYIDSTVVANKISNSQQDGLIDSAKS